MSDFKSVFKVVGNQDSTPQASGGDIMETIRQDLARHKVLLYMKGDRTAPRCGFSAAVVQVLDELGATYETRDILADEALRAAVKVYANWPTYPQLYINGKLIGGCDIVLEMAQHGELQPLLQQA